MASEERPEQYVAAGMGSAVVKYNSGVISTNVHLPFLPPDEVEAHAGLVLLPEARNRLFTGREEELARLHAAFRSGTGRSAQVVHGLGGVGKSALALEYAHRYREQYNPILRLPADSPEGMTAGLAGLADDLNHLLPQIAHSVEQRATWARNWLQCHSGWLLVLDNVERPKDVDALLGTLVGGHVLITTRQSTGWQARCGLLPLDVLAEDTAVELLGRLVADGGEEPELRELATELGGLPLALEQAAAYLNQSRTDPRSYVALLRDVPREAHALAAHSDENERTIARVWQHTLRSVEEEQPCATHVLRVLAWLAPDGVPRSLVAPLREDMSRPSGRPSHRLTGWTLPYARRRLAQRIGWLHARGRTAHRELTPLEINRALGVLHAYSLIRLDRDSVSLHRLVQSVARTPDPTSPFFRPPAVRAARQEATELLLRAAVDVPADMHGWVREQQLLPHMEAFLRALAPADDRPDTALILGYLVSYSHRWRTEEHARAVDYAERAVTAYRRHLVGGRFHPACRVAHSRLAEALLMAGEVERAVGLLGPERRHGALLPVRRDTLARCYLELGEPERAVPLLEAAVTDAARGGSRTHRELLRARGRLAEAYQAAGRLAQAVAVFERNLFDSLETLGEEDSDTVTARHQLAVAYLEAEDADRALALHERNLADALRVFGRGHSAVLISRTGLARACEQAGDAERAVALVDETLADARGLLDGEGYLLRVWQSERARLLLSVGQPERAVELHEQNLADWIRALGSHHPHVLYVRGGFAEALVKAGRPESAIPLLEENLRTAEEHLGPVHVATLDTKAFMALAFQESGDLERAVPLYEQLLHDVRSARGAVHPMSLETQVNCGRAYRDSGDLERAACLLGEALRDAEALYGRRHRCSVAARSALALTHAAAGDSVRAVTMLRRAVADAESYLAPGDSLRRDVRRRLAELDHTAGHGGRSRAGRAPAVPDQQDGQDGSRGGPATEPPPHGRPPRRLRPESGSRADGHAHDGGTRGGVATGGPGVPEPPEHPERAADQQREEEH